MLKKISKRARWVLAGCAVVTIGSTGCRNSMPGMNMFGWNRTPSAESLAGSGPTTTYPTPPSASAQPEAIASVAGGTAGSSDDPVTAPAAKGNSPSERVASLQGQPSYASAAPTGAAMNPSAGGRGASAASAAPSTAAPNMAAARANGIYGSRSSGPAGATGGTVPSYAQPASATSKPRSGYQLGKASAEASVAASSQAASSGYTFPSSKPTDLGQSAPAAPDAGGSTASSSAPRSGYTLPPGTASPKSTSGSEAASTASAPSKASQPEAAAAPSYSTATQPPTGSAPSSSTPSSSTGSGGGYRPGSTRGASGYPSSGYTEPSNGGGSFYR